MSEKLQYKYFAFISYSSKDVKWGERLKDRLQSYRMPATLCSEHGWKRKPINPVFFAPTDIQPNGLSVELQMRLRASRFLIVVCSPHSAQSEWVGKEIEFFHNLGRTENILFFIVDGIPHSGNPETECFNPIIEKLGIPEILGANIHEKVSRFPWINRERAFVQLVTRLLGVEFDSIWQRHKRLLLRKTFFWALSILLIATVIIGVRINSLPFNSVIEFNEISTHNPLLPPLKDAVVTISFGKETKTDTVEDIKHNAIFVNIPHHYLDSKVKVKVKCNDWEDVDTTIVLTRHISVNMYRDKEEYGRIHFTLWDDENQKVIPNSKVWIDDIETKSNRSGVVDILIPVNKQRLGYKVKATVPLENDSIYPPCSEDGVILVRN